MSARSPLFLSQRSAFNLSENALSSALTSARTRERRIFDLTESNPTRAGIPYDENGILAAIARPESLAYEPRAFGLDAAREAVARELQAQGQPVAASRIVLTASTSEAYAFLFKLLADPGDEVLVPVPSYPLFEHLARLESVVPVPYRLAYDGAWHLDLAALHGAISSRTRAVVVVNPNNPTGSYLKADELRAIAALGLPILSDEVFAQYSLKPDPRRAPSALLAAGAPLVFALGGLSKLAALPQLKLAWIAVGGEPSRVRAALARLEVIADAFLSVGTPVQHALPFLLASRIPAETAIARRTSANLRQVQAAVARSPVTLLDVEGGWYAALRLPGTRDDEDWALNLLENDGVYVHPGHFFDFDGQAYAVVSLLTREDILIEGMNRLVARVVSG